MFNAMRDHILTQIGLEGLLKRDSDDLPSPVETLTPEPFFAALDKGKINVEGFLQLSLGGAAANAGHVAVAELARAGAKVWTVNYDELIETALAGPHLTRTARKEQEDDVVPTADVMKPHGTLSAPFKIYTTQQVATGLPAAWRDRLAADVRDRTVVFIGSSGRDLDFVAVWPEVLTAARRVLWFTFVPSDAQERDTREAIELSLRNLGDRLMFIEERPISEGGNPTRRFVHWCLETGLIAGVDPNLLDLLWVPPVAAGLPPLQGPRVVARADILGKVGRNWAEEAELLKQCLTGPDRPLGLEGLIKARVHHSGPKANLVLAPLSSGPIRLVRPTLAEHVRKWQLEKSSNAGRVRPVLQALKGIEPRSANDVCYLTMATRAVGNLDEAVSIAQHGLRTFTACDPYLMANMSFQCALSLVWAGRFDEAQEELDSRTRPRARVTAVRWVAWETFTRAVLDIDRDRPETTAENLQFARRLFEWEGHHSASLYCHISELTAHRQRQDDAAFASALDSIRRSGRRRPMRARAAGDQTAALLIERGQFAQFHEDDSQRAEAFYRAACSSLPILNSQARLLLAMGQRDAHPDLTKADRIARDITCRPLLRLIEDFSATGKASEVFFA